MNNENMDFDKSELIKKLELLLELEAKKPINEMDLDLMDEIVRSGLELKGLQTKLTPEEVEEKVRKIPFVDTASLNTPPTSVKSRATKVKSRKILLIAAIISVFVSLFAVTSIAFEWNIFDELKNRFGTVADAPVNQEISLNGISAFMRGENKNYKTIEEALTNENIDVLYPGKLPDGIVFEDIVIYQMSGKDEISVVFNNSVLSYSITVDKGISSDIITVSTEKLKINNIECYIIDADDVSVVQTYFEYNGNLYYLSYNNKQELIEIIENLKEFKNEN